MPTARWFSSRLSTILVAALAVFVGGAQAQVTTAGNTFTITGIDVDVTGPDAIKAREQGIREAQGKAVKLLIDRMVAPEDRAKVPPLAAGQLDTMVRGVEFANERTAPNRYIATLSVVFAADPVKAWLSQGGISVVETVARAALVIPLWKGRNGVEPLDDRNPWRDAWTKLDTTASAVPVRVVRGDQIDQDAVGVEELFVGDVSALARLNERYNAPTVIVATVEGSRDGGPLSIGGIRYDAQTGARSEIGRQSVAGVAQLDDAAKQMHARLEQAWRSVAMVRRDSQDTIDVVVPIRTLGDWVQVRQRLGSVPAIKNITVKTLESDRADLKLEYFGSTEDLQKTLTQVGLSLVKEADQWRLQAR